MTRAQYQITVLAGHPDSEDAQDRLDALMAPEGAGSLKERVERDRSLGGVVCDVSVTGCTGYSVFQRAGESWLGATWTVETL
jgi:hypothetical protein